MERAIIANRKHDKGEVRKEMSERKMKRVEDSLTEQSHLLMPKCLNAAGYLFGGQLLAWIDETAGIVAKRHAEMNVVTVAVDNMYFQAGARVNDTIVLIGRLTPVGRSSCLLSTSNQVYYLIPDGICGPCTVGFFRQKIVFPESFPMLHSEYDMAVSYTHLSLFR